MQELAHPTNSASAPRPKRFAMTDSWCVEILPRAPYCTNYVPESSTLGFAFDVQSGVHGFASDRRIDFRAKPNSLAYVPTGCDVFSESDHGGEYLKVTLARDQSEMFQSTRHFSDVIDGVAIFTAQELRKQLLSNDCIDALRAERLVYVLIERALRALGRAHVGLTSGSCMTVRRLRLVDDLIDSKLDGKLTVQDLAQALGLSTGFFSRAFKAAIGKSPYEYIVDRRISRARLLLQGTEDGLIGIAHAVGFSSHAHMTATFRHRLGVTPAELRKSPNKSDYQSAMI